MRLFLIVLLLLPLAGCFSDQKNAMARCVAKAKAENLHSAEQTDEEYIDSLDGPISDCMKVAGYYYYSAKPDCTGSHTNPYCYAVQQH